MAATAGLRDGSGQARVATLDLARGLTALPVTVSVDVEGGFSEDAGAVRELGAEPAPRVWRGSAPVTYEIPTYQQVQDLVP